MGFALASDWPDPPCGPPLKWAGGKRWQTSHLLPLWQRFPKRRLVEPFCGGLAMVMGLRPAFALLNDVNAHLINFYGWLKEGLTVGLGMSNDATTFYCHRARFNYLLSSGLERTDEAATLFYYLNRTGYNGLCRFNRRGEFNVPFGRYARINYRRDFSVYRAAFSGWEFTFGDFEQIRLQPDDFVYADPPYDVEFTHYTKEGFTWGDQVRAAQWLAGHPGPVVLSNQATERIIELYLGLGFELRFLTAPRKISCTGDRSPVREVLALRNIQS
ncbi:MAG: DNA adenine methylase [Candidatus Binataceae bacterium]